MRVKIYGAGSIGNHLTHAARSLGWSVDVVDPDGQALARMRNSIYPTRYGKWDEAIRQFDPKDQPKGGYDLVCVGTPPDSHIALARGAVAERARAVLVEKPLCGPDLANAQALALEAAQAGVAGFVGYDHVVGRAARLAASLIAAPGIGTIQTLDVEFREFWGGIFAAHPWLSGPSDSYLGYSARGGGASGEHSHAANLWQYFAHAVGAGRVVSVQATLDMVEDGTVAYDRICAMTLATQNGLVGRCIQDVVTQPPRKWARFQGSDGFVEWTCGHSPGIDQVEAALPGRTSSVQRVAKTRPDDFIEELRHIEEALAGDPSGSPIALARGLDTMLVVAAAHLSHRSGRRVSIDYSKGCTLAALSTH